MFHCVSDVRICNHLTAHNITMSLELIEIEGCYFQLYNWFDTPLSITSIKKGFGCTMLKEKVMFLIIIINYCDRNYTQFSSM